MCARHQKDQLLRGRRKEPGMTNWQRKEAASGKKPSFTKWKGFKPQEEGSPRGMAGQVQTRKWRELKENWRWTLQGIWKKAHVMIMLRRMAKGAQLNQRKKQHGFLRGKPCLINLPEFFEGKEANGTGKQIIDTSLGFSRVMQWTSKAKNTQKMPLPFNRLGVVV